MGGMTSIRPTAMVAIIAALLLAALALAGCMQPKDFDEKAWQESAQKADAAALRAPHYDPETGTYFNPWMSWQFSFWNLMRWRLSKNALGPDAGENAPQVPQVANDGAYLKDAGAPDSLTWLGHATYALQLGGKVLLTDPFFADAIWWVVQRQVPPAFGLEVIPKGSLVLISHNHYDHLDEDSIKALAERDAKFICPLGLGEMLRDFGAKDVTEMDWWQKLQSHGVTITSLPVQHWSRRHNQSFNQSLWCSYMIEGQGRRIYYGADSGYFMGFAQYGKLFPGIDVAMLGLGAYYPRWFMHYAHMNLPETMRSFNELGAKLLVPTQWGVLALGDEPASWPLKEMRGWLKEHPKDQGRVKMLPVGGRLMLE